MPQNYKKPSVKEALEAEASEFYQSADPLACLEVINYLLLCRDDETDPLTSIDNAHLRSLSRMLVSLTRLKFTGSIEA